MSNRLTNKIFGNVNRRVVTLGEWRKATLGLPPETMIGIQTGENVGSIFTLEIQDRTPKRKPINPTNPKDGDYWVYGDAQKLREPTPVLVLVASTSADIRESDMPNFEVSEKETDEDENPNQRLL